MSHKTVILTKEQMERLCEGESFTYLKDYAEDSDMGNIYATQVTTDGSMDGKKPVPTTADDRSHTMASDWRGNAKLAGAGPIVVHESKKSEWAERNLMGEESEHGNMRLQNRRFGAKDGQAGKSYTATKMAISRKKRAEDKLHNGTPEEKMKAQKTLQRMRSNWAGIDAAEQQYSSAKISDEIIQGNKIGPKMKSAPKNSGNGQAHTPKTPGVFLNQ